VAHNWGWKGVFQRLEIKIFISIEQQWRIQAPRQRLFQHKQGVKSVKILRISRIGAFNTT